ncbi:hypothetical protein ACFU9X_41165 [Streptomyces atratus]
MAFLTFRRSFARHAGQRPEVKRLTARALASEMSLIDHDADAS